MTLTRTFTAGHARAATVLALVAFVGFLVVPDDLRTPALVVLLATAAAVVVLGVGWMRRRRSVPAVGVVDVASALGLVGSVLYLDSLADEPSAIPIAGSLVLLLSLVGLVVSAVRLRSTPRRRPLSR